MLQRYKRLLEYPVWREPFTKSYISILPYSEAMNLNQLHGLFAWHVGQSGDPQRALDMLDQEAGFWRRVLAGSNTIIGRVIAAAALERNLQWTNAVLREAQPAHSLSVPKNWRQALTPEERDWRRAFAGEIRLLADFSEWLVAEEDASVLDVLMENLGAPLFQPTATLNYTTDRYHRVNQALSVPYRELTGAVDRIRQQEREKLESNGIFSAYNPVGHVLGRISAAHDTANYGLRITDLEGIRRMLLLAAELRANGIAAEDIQSEVDASEIRNPYTGAAFNWDADAVSFTFTGAYSWGEDDFVLPY